MHQVALVAGTVVLVLITQNELSAQHASSSPDVTPP